MASALRHINNPDLFTHPVRNSRLRDNFRLPRHFLGLRCGARRWPTFVHTTNQEIRFWGKSFDCLDTLVAGDLGHFHNPDLFTHPFRNMHPRDTEDDYFNTFLAWDLLHLNNPDLFTHPFCNLVNVAGPCPGTKHWRQAPPLTAKRENTQSARQSFAGLSLEIISDSVELCFKTEVWFLHIQLMVTNVSVISDYTPNSTEVDFESSRFPGKNSETSPTCIVVLCVPHDIIAWNVCDECKKSNEPNVCHNLSSILVTARANLITDHGMSGPPNRAKYKHVKTICEYIFLNSPTAPNSYSLNWWSSKHGIVTLQNCWVVLFASSQHHNAHFFAGPSIAKDQEKMSASSFPEQNSFPFAPAQVLDANIFMIFLNFANQFLHRPRAQTRITFSSIYK